jgi:inorganic pyrophosphatase/manganese-dependent inorganic pyrophosphatase
MNENVEIDELYVVTAGSAYLDIDAYACCVAMTELLQLKGKDAIAYSSAQKNYSVCESVFVDGIVQKELPSNYCENRVKYIIVDVSDPRYLEKNLLQANVWKVYDHHLGFESYWAERIGKDACIEFIGAAATLIYREWKKERMTNKMSAQTAKMLIAAILDNTLNLCSQNTTDEDIQAFEELCIIAGVGQHWCTSYFEEVQASIESDLKGAVYGDIKAVANNPILPSYVGQIAVWNAAHIIKYLPEIREWLNDQCNSWFFNIIDIHKGHNYFVCDSAEHQNRIEKLFDVRFEAGIAKTHVIYLRKEIIKKTVF